MPYVERNVMNSDRSSQKTGFYRLRRLLKNTKLLKFLLPFFYPENPVYVFHHIPKCGGTSLVHVLSDWFFLIRDYRSGWETINYPKKIKLNSLRSIHCLCGHWELYGYHIFQRYPAILNLPERFRLFAFIRDPLEISLSLFRYEKKNNRNKTISLEQHLSLRPNYLANIFPVSRDNYKNIIDRYFFIGILEEGQASLDLFAKLIGKKSYKMPLLNKTKSNKPTKTMLNRELFQKFRYENELDYLIYDYCKEKFRKTLSGQGNS